MYILDEIRIFVKIIHKRRKELWLLSNIRGRFEFKLRSISLEIVFEQSYLSKSSPWVGPREFSQKGSVKREELEEYRYLGRKDFSNERAHRRKFAECRTDS